MGRSIPGHGFRQGNCASHGTMTAEVAMCSLPDAIARTIRNRWWRRARSLLEEGDKGLAALAFVGSFATRRITSIPLDTRKRGDQGPLGRRDSAQPRPLIDCGLSCSSSTEAWGLAEKTNWASHQKDPRQVRLPSRRARNRIRRGELRARNRTTASSGARSSCQNRKVISKKNAHFR